MHIRAARAKPPANARHLGANGCRPASVPAIGSAATREHNGSIVLPNRAIRGWVDLRCRRADLLSPARRAHDAGESRVAVRGAGSAARGDRTRSQSQRSSSQRRRALLLIVPSDSATFGSLHARNARPGRCPPGQRDRLAARLYATTTAQSRERAWCVHFHGLCRRRLTRSVAGLGAAANDVPGGAWIVALATVRPSPSPAE